MFRMSTVVVVEDNPALLDMFEVVLKKAGYTVVVAVDGATALALADGIQDERILLLTDIVLPGINGKDLAAEFVRRHPTARVGMMSGWTSHPILTGLNVLLKPFTIAELLDFTAKIDGPSTPKPDGVILRADCRTGTDFIF